MLKNSNLRVNQDVFTETCFFDEKNLFTLSMFLLQILLLQHGETYICFLRGI